MTERKDESAVNRPIRAVFGFLCALHYILTVIPSVAEESRGNVLVMFWVRFREMFRQAQHDTLSVIPSVAEESRGNEKGSLILIVLPYPKLRGRFP